MGEGTVSVMVGGNLKIRDYKMPIKDDQDCRFYFYIGSKDKGTDFNEFLEGERLESAQKGDQITELEIDLEQNNINEIKATDIAWLVIGCNYNGNADKLAVAMFPDVVEIPTTTTTTTTAKPTTKAEIVSEPEDKDIVTEPEDKDPNSAPGQVGLWTPLMLFSFYLA